jgi:hypothetical protein
MVSADPVDIKAQFPYVVCWPRDMTPEFCLEVCAKYLSNTSNRVNWFDCCVLLHKAETPQRALASVAKAFATKVGRDTLLAIASEARNSQWCKGEVLDCIERYATYAFVLDGTDMTCGTIPPS